MTEKTIILTLTLSEDEVHAFRAAMLKVAEFQPEVGECATHLTELDPNAVSERDQIAKTLREKAKEAHECSRLTWDILRRAQLHEAKGGVQ